MDSAGNHKELELPITYCPSDIELKLNLSATEVNKYLNGSYFINIGKELEEYGLTQDFMSNLSITALFGGLEVGWWDEFPLLTPIRDKIAIGCMLRQIHESSSHAIRHGLYIKNRKRLFCL